MNRLTKYFSILIGALAFGDTAFKLAFSKGLANQICGAFAIAFLALGILIIVIGEIKEYNQKKKGGQQS